MMPTILSISLGEMGRVRLCSLRRFITCVVNSLHACKGRRGLETVLCRPTRIPAQAWLLGERSSGETGRPWHSPIPSSHAQPLQQITHTLSLRPGTVLGQPGKPSNCSTAPSTPTTFCIPTQPAGRDKRSGSVCARAAGWRTGAGAQQPSEQSLAKPQQAAGRANTLQRVSSRLSEGGGGQ